MDMSETGALHFARKIALFALAWPYYRALHRRTIEPTRQLLESKDIQELSRNTTRWIEGKDRELRDVKVAATISLAMTVGIFSWPEIANTSWYSKGFWYGSFIMAIIALIATSQESILLDEMMINKEAYKSAKDEEMDRTLSRESDPTRTGAANRRSIIGEGNASTTTAAFEQMLSHVLVKRRRRAMRASHDNRWRRSIDINEEEDLQEWLQGCRASLIMLFIWQTPLMLMSWSWVAFVVALSLHVLVPFIDHHPWGDDSKIAVMFLSFLGPGLSLFVLSAFFPYSRTTPSSLVNIFQSLPRRLTHRSPRLTQEIKPNGNSKAQGSSLTSSRPASPIPTMESNATKTDHEAEPV